MNLEFDLIVRGANYGWPIWEATHRYRTGPAPAGGLPTSRPILNFLVPIRPLERRVGACPGPGARPLQS